MIAESLGLWPGLLAKGGGRPSEGGRQKPFALLDAYGAS